MKKQLSTNVKCKVSGVTRSTLLDRSILMTILGNIFFSANAQDAQNVLFIAVDDLKAIGTLFQDEENDFLAQVYPDPEIRREVAARMTPNIQRLSDEGVNFMSAYCPSPACNPSRTAIMTGVRPHVSGMANNAGSAFFREWKFEGERPLADATTLPELLKNNGWYTASTGKIYHQYHLPKHSDVERSWTDWTMLEQYAGDWVLSDWSPVPLLDEEGNEDWSATPAGRVRWGQEGEDHQTFVEMSDYRAADFFARLIENGEAERGDVTFALPDDAPFFLALGIFRPHLPFITTKDLIDLFPVEEMTVTRELLEFFIRDGADLPAASLAYSGIRIGDDGEPELGSGRFPGVLRHGLSVDPDDGDIKAWMDMLSHYFASTALADRSVGRVLDALDASPYSDNTMVILWSDHGFHLGEKMHVAKFTLWNDGSRVPFIIKDPRFPQSAGMRSHAPVSLMDIYPTVASVAGLELPDSRITGSDLSPLLADPTLGRDDPVLVTYQRNLNIDEYDHTVRKGRYKLIYLPRGGQEHVELYDVARDPQEYYNLAGLPEYADVEASMMEVLKEALKRGHSNP